MLNNKPITMSPVPHSLSPQYYLVALEQCFANQRTNNFYKLYLFNNLIRIYTPDNLPNIIKTHLTIIRVSPDSNSYIPDDKLIEVDMYCHKQIHDSTYIGWRASENMYVIVLDKNEIDKLCS
jgi:hypothetical protein